MKIYIGNGYFFAIDSECVFALYDGKILLTIPRPSVWLVRGVCESARELTSWR